MLERVIERKLVGRAKSRGVLVRKVVYVGRNGSPDRWFFYLGRVMMIELKKANGKLSLVQKSEIEQLRAHGMEVHVCYGLDEALKVLDEWCDAVENEKLI